MEWVLLSRILFAKFADASNHPAQFLLRHAGINSYPEGLTHGSIGFFERSDLTIVGCVVSELVEARMFQKVSCK